MAPDGRLPNGRATHGEAATPVLFGPPLEDAYLPLPGRIVSEVDRLLGT